MKTVTGRVEYRDGLGYFGRLFVTVIVTSLVYHTHTPIKRRTSDAA